MKINFNYKVDFRISTKVYKCSERARCKSKYSTLGHIFLYCWLVCIWQETKRKRLVIRKERAF